MKILHIAGGKLNSGAFKGANILHQALLELKVDSKILNDSPPKSTINNKLHLDKNIIFINKKFINMLKNKFFLYLEKFLKALYLPSPRGTFTLGLFGFDVTKLQEYKDADIIHIHWLNQGFIKIKSLSKINKPIIWTMRDMWAFSGGSHYTMDFEKYEDSQISKIIKNYKKKIYNNNFQFIAISDWLKNKAQTSTVLRNFKVNRIYNNIDTRDFNLIDQEAAKKTLNILTSKQIILYGAQNPQSKRKGWDIFIKALKKLDKSNFYLLIFGNFWSQKILDDIGIEYKNLGFVDNKKIINAIYSSADIFVAPSLQEAFGKTFAESMLCETPVVCFSDTSISEIVDHKVNGYIVENVDADELKDGINWLSKELRNNNYVKGRARPKVIDFDAKIIAKKYIEIYKNTLNY